jgi:hypothetical protein
MISWKIWRNLRNPPFSHPLFRRILINRTAIQMRESDAYSYTIMNARFVIELLASMMICAAMFSPVLIILGGIGLMLILNGTGYSLLWAVKTSGLIAQAREQQTYEIYCVSPEGALGVNWAICTGFLHRNGRLDQIHTLVRSLLIMGLVMVGIVGFLLVSNSANGYASELVRGEVERSSLMLVHVLVVIAAIFIDHIHSIVLGSIVSILVPTYTRRKIDSQLGTFAVYLLLQIGTYLLAGVIALEILPAVYAGSQSWLGHISLALLQVASFFAIREIVISLLWGHVANRLGITTTEGASIGLAVFKLGVGS